MYGHIPQVIQKTLSSSNSQRSSKRNVRTDALSAFGNNSKDQIKRTILVQKIDRPTMILASEKAKIVTPILEITGMEVDKNPPNKEFKVATADWRLPINTIYH